MTIWSWYKDVQKRRSVKLKKKFVIGKDSKGAATLCRQTLWKEKVYSKEIKWLDIGNGQYILVIC